MFGLNKKLFALLLLAPLFLAGCVSVPSEPTETGASSVSELLENPVYGEDVRVYGKASLLGELFCPCFRLTSKGESLEVWYGLMVEDRRERPSVSVEGIQNGDWVVATGELRPSEGSAPSTTFWASKIEKTSASEGVTRAACDALTPCGEGLECIKFPGLDKPYCSQPNPCSYFDCGEKQCVVAESYPPQVFCS